MEMRRKFGVPLKIAVLIAVLALLVAGCGQPAAPASEEMAEEPAEETTSVEGVMDVPREQTLIVGWWGSDEFEESEIYTPFAIGGDYQRGLNVIYEGMAYWNAFRDETVMWQAESFDYNDDYTELTISLRPEVMWSDGTPFTAHDVVYTINHLIEIGGEVRFGNEVQQYTEGAVAADDHTAVITLKFPFPRYHDRFFVWKWDSGAFPIMPKHIFEGQDWATFTHYDIEKGWPVTTGPLKVVYSSPQQKMFDRRDDWWAVESGLTDELNMERVMFVVGGTDQTRLIELVTSNQIDITELQGASIRMAVERNEKVTAHYGRQAPYGYVDWWAQALWLNNEKPPYDDVHVRWGISYLIDRQQIADIAYEGLTSPNPMPYPPYPGLEQYTESISDLLEEYNTNEYNPEKAAAHLEAAGYSMNDDGMWADADGNTIKVPVESWFAWNAPGEVLVEQLKRGGIEAELTTPPDAWDRFVSKTYTAFPAGHTGSLKEPYEALNLYTCGKEGGPAANWASNQALWCNEAFDEVVLEMSRVHPEDTETMKALFRQAMEIWLPELPAVMLFNWKHNMAMNQTYWENWPTVDSKDGEYVNEAPQLLGFHLVLLHLEPAE
ncbi:MAG: ABC transporter substrate-binding protein [Caldilineaceae bacterium]|nr:ABC transporter substrate-binding protein [Caldilineaceae bacterium]